MIFFITTIVSLVFNLVADNSGDNSIEEGATSWSDCWKLSGEDGDDD